jgi:hypothetical protein
MGVSAGGGDPIGAGASAVCAAGEFAGAAFISAEDRGDIGVPILINSETVTNLNPFA